ncbi:hypothetical protein EV702DRAFT_1044910 [Suillus placidus]|uniref:Uncharacterized protein n=1 Tax=Suillus placidus TaxID=48579 RepID=A0A9P6ZWK0_9AGAM|nr:hypothetical protein EV702DRAFT_1044910 [Suillus placidus]
MEPNSISGVLGVWAMKLPSWCPSMMVALWCFTTSGCKELLAAPLSASVTFGSATSHDRFLACGGVVTLTHTTPLICMANPNNIICQFTEDAFATEDRLYCKRPALLLCGNNATWQTWAQSSKQAVNSALLQHPLPNPASHLRPDPQIIWQLVNTDQQYSYSYVLVGVSSVTHTVEVYGSHWRYPLFMKQEGIRKQENICEGKKDIDAQIDAPSLINLALETVLLKLHAFGSTFSWRNHKFIAIERSSLCAKGKGKAEPLFADSVESNTNLTDSPFTSADPPFDDPLFDAEFVLDTSSAAAAPSLQSTHLISLQQLPPLVPLSSTLMNVQ